MPRRWCRFALLGVIGVSGVGCVSSEKPPPPLGLTPGLQSTLGTKSDPSTPPSVNPSATGGKGGPAASSLNRTKPAGSGMGVSLPPPQLASNTAAPTVSAPVQPGVSVAPPSADTARLSRPAPRDVEPIQPPAGGALPPPTEPPMTRANYPQPSTQPAVNLSVPLTDPDPMPRPVPPPPPAAPPIAPDGPASLSPLKPAADGPPLPGGPLAPIEPLRPR